MDIERCRSQAAKWAPAAPASFYDRSGANLYNFNVRDPNLRLWLLSEVAQRQVDVPAQDLYWLNDVYITSSTIIYSTAGVPLEVSLADQTHTPLLTHAIMDSAPTIDAPVAFIFKAGKDNYGHFLIEMLPRLEHLFALGCGQITLLVPPVNEYISRILTQVIQELFPGAFMLLPMTTDIIRIKEVLVPGPVTRHNRQKSAVVGAFGERVRRKIVTGGGVSDSIYVSRSGVKNRRMTNEIEVEQAMEDAGFTIIHPESMGFFEQAASFSSAKRIVGPLGAGLSNILFSDAGTEIMMIAPGMQDMFFYDLACLRKQVFSWIFTETINMFDTSILHRNYSVDITLIKQALQFNGR